MQLRKRIFSRHFNQLELNFCAPCKEDCVFYIMPFKRCPSLYSTLLGHASTCCFMLHCIYIHLRAHSSYVDSPLGPDAFQEYESLLSQDYEELLRKSNTKSLLSLDSKASVHTCSTSSKDCVLNSEISYTGRERDGSQSFIHMEAHKWPSLVVSVHHFPMILCALSPRVFVFPSKGTLGEACLSNDHEDALSPGLPALSSGHTFDGDETPSGAILTAHFIYELVSKMDLKMEIFSMGDLSNAIGKILTDMSSLYDVGRRDKRSAGLLLIDRSLDFLTPCCHGDSLVDRILSSSQHGEGKMPSLHMRESHVTGKHIPPKVERPSIDVRISLGTIFSNKKESEVSKNQLSEVIAAFMSGWNLKSAGSEIVGQTDEGDKFNHNSLIGSDYGTLCGSLVSNERYLGANYFEALFERKTKDGAVLIKKWLMETIRRDKIPLAMKGRLSSVTASDLHSLITLLASNEITLIRNKGIILLALAAETALSEPHSSRWDAFMSAERILTMSVGDTSQSLSSQIRDLINTSIFMRSSDQNKDCGSPHLLSFQDALLLAITGYIMAGENFPTTGSNGPFSWEEEHSLKEAVVDAILEMPITPKFRFLQGLELENNSGKGESGEHQKDSAGTSIMVEFDDQWGWGDEVHSDEKIYGNMQLKLELRDRVDNLFKFFHKLSRLKWRNPALKEGHVTLERYFGGDAYSKKGLISKILTMVLAKHDLPGLEYHSSAVGRFFKSGFGRFGLGQSKPRLGDQGILLVFVVGGINGIEVFEAQKAISESDKPDIELILGGTAFLTPDNMFELLLGSSSYI